MTNKFWTITDNKNMKTSELIEEAKKLFKNVYIYDEKDIDKQFPPPKETYTVKFRASIEPDKEHLAKSYNDFMAEKDKKWMTMRQYLILAMQVYKQTGEYLDVEGWTRTSDLWSDGGLVCGDWRDADSWLCLSGGSRDRRSSGRGPRESVLLEPSPLYPSEPSGLHERVQKLEEFRNKIEKIINL